MRIKESDFSSKRGILNGIEYRKISLPLAESVPSPYGFEEFSESSPVNDYGLKLGEMHTLDFYFVAWVKRGHCDFFVDMISTHLEDNTLVFIRPGQFHTIKNLSKIDGAAFCFGESFFANMQPKIAQRLKFELFIHLNFIKVTEAETEKKLDDILRVLVTMMKNEDTDENHKLSVYSMLGSLLLTVMASPEYRMAVAQESGRFSHRRELYIHFIDLVEKNYTRWHLVKDYLVELCVSQKILSVCTVENAGETPLGIINGRLLLEAKRMLLYTEMRVVDISDQLGFTEPAHFVKFFRRHLEVTPSEFRKAL